MLREIRLAVVFLILSGISSHAAEGWQMELRDNGSMLRYQSENAAIFISFDNSSKSGLLEFYIPSEFYSDVNEIFNKYSNVVDAGRYLSFGFPHDFRIFTDVSHMNFSGSGLFQPNECCNLLNSNDIIIRISSENSEELMDLYTLISSLQLSKSAEISISSFRDEYDPVYIDFPLDGFLSASAEFIKSSGLEGIVY